MAIPTPITTNNTTSGFAATQAVAGVPNYGNFTSADEVKRAAYATDATTQAKFTSGGGPLEGYTYQSAAFSGAPVATSQATRALNTANQVTSAVASTGTPVTMSGVEAIANAGGGTSFPSSMAPPSTVQQAIANASSNTHPATAPLSTPALPSINPENPAEARLQNEGLEQGGGSPPAAQAEASWESTDWRVKVSVGKASGVLYQKGSAAILEPIKRTGGVIFPITPTVQMTHTAKYSGTTLTHSNYAMQFYESSEIGQISINGEFPVQNIEEGKYLLGAIYFFRAATKMFWGDETHAGAPPPLVYLSGYGKYYFPKVPCVVISFAHTMPEDKDYIEVPVTGETDITRIPTQSTVQVVLQPVYSRNSLTTFKMQDLAEGKMINGGFI